MTVAGQAALPAPSPLPAASPLPWWPAFALGLLFGLGFVAAVRPPRALQAGWCRVRHGAWPGPQGLVLQVRPAPPSLRGEGSGPWLLVELINAGREAREVFLSRPPGEELELLRPDGTPFELDPAREARARPVAPVTLAPGQRVAQVLDVGARAWLEPGPLQLRVRRRPLVGLDEVEAESGEVELVAR